jgi:hypothetical protein
MDGPWCVRLTEQGSVYGPFADRRIAGEFASYLSDEVDPAQVLPLCNPLADLLNWRAHIALPAMDDTAAGQQTGLRGDSDGR